MELHCKTGNHADHACTFAGYAEVKPVVFCGLFPTDNNQFEPLRDSLGKLQLNDAALSYEPEVQSLALCMLLLGQHCGPGPGLYSPSTWERYRQQHENYGRRTAGV